MLIIDRIEEGIAVCEADDGGHMYLREFPADAREGSVLRKDENGWAVDEEETARRRELARVKSSRIKGRRRPS
jgi:hypothetical protein